MNNPEVVDNNSWIFTKCEVYLKPALGTTTPAAPFFALHYHVKHRDPSKHATSLIHLSHTSLTSPNGRSSLLRTSLSVSLGMIYRTRSFLLPFRVTCHPRKSPIVLMYRQLADLFLSALYRDTPKLSTARVALIWKLCLSENTRLRWAYWMRSCASVVAVVELAATYSTTGPQVNRGMEIREGLVHDENLVAVTYFRFMTEFTRRTVLTVSARHVRVSSSERSIPSCHRGTMRWLRWRAGAGFQASYSRYSCESVVSP